MGKRIRIGKDIAIAWHITLPEDTDELLSDMDLTIAMKDPKGLLIAIKDYVVNGNDVLIGLKGTAFAWLGNYTLTLWKNKGKDGQTVVDAVNAFTLVNSTDKETGVGRGGCGVLELSTVDLYSELEFFFAGEVVDASILSRITALETAVSQMATQISGLQSDITNLTARVEALEHEEPPAPPVTYTITRNLSHVTSSNSSNSVNEGSSYTTTLSLASGYENMQVTVTMGGVDITSSALSNNVVTIASVSGNVVITATATQIPVEVEYIYGGGAFSTASSISYADLVIDTTVDASTKTITFGVDNQNHIGIIAPASLTLTSCLHIDAITEDLTAEFASSAQTITYNGKSMKLYQVKSTAGKMYNTTFRANFS